MDSSTDINECKSRKGGCHHRCTNTEGSFQCHCKQGFSLNTDGTTCRGIVSIVELYFFCSILTLILCRHTHSKLSIVKNTYTPCNAIAKRIVSFLYRVWWLPQCNSWSHTITGLSCSIPCFSKLLLEYWCLYGSLPQNYHKLGHHSKRKMRSRLSESPIWTLSLHEKTVWLPLSSHLLYFPEYVCTISH